MSVTIITTLGDLDLDLHYRLAPRTCRNFIELAKAGYYDGIPIHRLVPGFMLQTGDPLGDGTGGESIYGPEFEDEIVARLAHDKTGVVSMANAGPNTNTSQFFITFKACPHLDGKHTIFGQVRESSVAVLDEFQVVKTKDKKPVKPLKIFSVMVTDDPWEDEDLPPDAIIPDKPLVGDGDDSKKCTVS